MFPQIATEYYTKRSGHVKEVEEYKLREVTTAAIPSGTDGWREDFSIPKIIIRQSATQEAPSTPHLRPALLQHGQLTPPPSSDNVPIDLATSSPKLDATLLEKHSTPVYIDALPRQPPHSCKPSPPPQSMSAAARLACLARWTAFTPTGTPYLLSSPHAKDFDLQWLDAIESGFSEQGLVEWAREMWWAVWVRQCVVNWRGIWAKRFEKEDVKAETVRKEAEEATERARVEEEGRKKAEELVEKQRKKVLGRLEGLNKALRLVEVKE
jgi:hypothetical protein